MNANERPFSTVMKLDGSVTTLSLKEEGNTYFKDGKFDEAVECYSEGIKLGLSQQGESQFKDELSVLYKNRSACFLKKGEYENAAKDATASLELVNHDAKALFRRAQANEKLGRLEEAFKDANSAYQLDPKNGALQNMLRTMTVTVQEKASKSQTTEGIVNEMITIIMDHGSAPEKQQQALKNLTILAHQSAGSGVMFKTKALNKLKPLIFDENPNNVVAFLKMLHGLCEGSYSRSLAMMQLLPVSELKFSLGKFTGNIDVVSNLLSVVIEVITSMVQFGKEQHPISAEDTEKWVKKNQNEEDIRTFLEKIPEYGDLMLSVVGNFSNPHLTAEARDCVVDALIKMVPLHKSIADFVLKNHGVKCLLQVASSCGSLTAKQKPTLPVSGTLCSHIAIALSSIYSAIHQIEKQREEYNKQADDAVSKFFEEPKESENVKGLASLIAILEGSTETGEQIVSKETILDKVLNLTQSDELEVKILAGEALAYAASIKKVCVTLRATAMGKLKSLFKANDDRLKARGLVCMCKVGMTGAGNIHEEYISEDGVEQLYESCIKFLTSQEDNSGFKKLAVEALAFLTMNGDVKEKIVSDSIALTALFGAAKSGDSTTIYAVCNCLVNLTNSFDKPEKMEEMEKLAEYSQHKIPKLGEKDAPEFVKKRISILVSAGITTALVHLVAKISSNVSKESIARIFHGIVTDQEHRGIIVQQGGGKSLIPLALSGTATGKDLAAQAIAKIGITTNPSLAFPGQRCLEVVRPLLMLLDPDKKSLQQFEALMALTNLAQISDDVRRRIIKEKGITAIETFMFDEHELLRLAATECMCNMTMCEDIVNMFLDETSKTERLKLIVLYCGEHEDPKLVRAATGALAILSANKKICEKLLMFKSSMDILKQNLLTDDLEVQHRAVYIISNMLESCKEVAEKLIESDIFEIFLAMMQTFGEGRKEMKEHIKRGLKAAQGWGIIKENK